MDDMTAAEFACTLDQLGLHASWFAEHQNVSLRAVRAWESGEHSVPVKAVAELQHLQMEYTHSVAHYVELNRKGGVFHIPRTDRDVSRMRPANDFPAAWWHRVGMEVVGASGARLEWL